VDTSTFAIAKLGVESDSEAAAGNRWRAARRRESDRERLAFWYLGGSEKRCGYEHTDGHQQTA
jgi:hypothetical protein